LHSAQHPGGPRRHAWHGGRTHGRRVPGGRRADRSAHAGRDWAPGGRTRSRARRTGPAGPAHRTGNCPSNPGIRHGHGHGPWDARSRIDDVVHHQRPTVRRRPKRHHGPRQNCGGMDPDQHQPHGPPNAPARVAHASPRRRRVTHLAGRGQHSGLRPRHHPRGLRRHRRPHRLPLSHPRPRGPRHDGHDPGPLNSAHPTASTPPTPPDEKKVRYRMDRSAQSSNSLTLTGSVALGTGVMIGAGIFALVGQVAELAGGWMPWVFLAGAVVVAFSSYSYIRYSATNPSSSGIAMQLKAAYGPGVVAGSVSLFMYVSIILAESLLGRTFVTYMLRPVGMQDSYLWVPLLAVLAIPGAALVILVGNQLVERSATVTAALKIVGIA